MKCIHCHRASIILRPTWTGVEICCPGCGRVYSADEVKALVHQIRLAGKGKFQACPGK